jgi:hypothetical protein
MSESQRGRGAFSNEFERRDARLVTRALSQGWPIPQAVRQDVVEQVSGIVKTGGAGPRDVIAAARVLLSASRINLEVVKTVIKAQDQEDVLRSLDQVEHRQKMEEQGRAAAGASFA